MKPCNENIEKTIRIADALLDLAGQGDIEREDVGCGVLYGIMRDSAYRIKKAAEAEKAAHMRKGNWK